MRIEVAQRASHRDRLLLDHGGRDESTLSDGSHSGSTAYVGDRGGRSGRDNVRAGGMGSDHIRCELHTELRQVDDSKEVARRILHGHLMLVC